MIAPSRVRSITIVAMLASMILIQSIALLDLILFPNYQVTYGSFFLQLTNGLFAVLAPFCPALFLLVLYTSPTRYLLSIASRYAQPLNRFLKWMSRGLTLQKEWVSFWKESGRFSSRWYVLLIAGLSFSMVIAYLPYRRDLNPQATLVGVDAPIYSGWVSNMLARPIYDAIAYAFISADNGSRPIPLLILYSLAAFSGADADAVVRLAPVILAPLLAGASFLFVWYGTGDTRAACLTAILSACSYQLTVGVWAGYYANWLALAESYTLLTGFLLFSKNRSRKAYLLIFSASLILLFTHPWTWTIVLVLVTLVAAENYLNNRNISLLKPILLLAAFDASVDLARILIIGSYGGEKAAYDIATRASPFEIANAWPNSVSTFQHYDGYLANAVYLVLALVAMISLYRTRNEFSRVLVLWTTLSALPFVLFDSIVQSRVIYVTPVPILAVIGLLRITQNLQEKMQVLLILTIVLLEANVAVLSMVQLVSIPG